MAAGMDVAQPVGRHAAGSRRSSVTVAVPEPSTYAMLLLSLGALGATARRRAREQQDSVNTPQR
jgi:hypothetical protein